MTKSWYAYIGGEDPTNVRNYIKLPNGKHSCLCGPILCSIYAAGNDSEEYPYTPLSVNIQKYIRQALATQQLQPETPYYAKKYVYLRY